MSLRHKNLDGAGRIAALLPMGLFAAQLWLLPVAACAQSQLIRAPSEASPLTIVSPTFPAGRSAPPAGVRVDITGTVRVNGEFKPESVTAENGQQPFIDAVSEVLRYWRFEPGINEATCTPREALSSLSVWFEGSDAAPRIFISQPKKTAAESQKPPPTLDWIQAPEVGYSEKALGTEGRVKVLYLVTPDGEVKSVAVRSSTPCGFFDAGVLFAAKRTRISWKDPEPTENVCAQRECLFCMPSAETATLPLPECRKLK